MSKAIWPAMLGKRFGRLLVKRRATKETRGTYLACVCVCGNKREVALRHLRTGATQSCGCLAGERTTQRNLKHGDDYRGKRAPEYNTWAGMRGRCTNPKDKLFPYYGGRGIALCRRWRGPHGYKNFLKDVGRRPSKGFSLDRINNMKGYTPSNVRWATRAEQARNKRSSILITIRGREMCLKDWCRHFEIDYKLVHARMRKGKTFNEARAAL